MKYFFYLFFFFKFNIVKNVNMNFKLNFFVSEKLTMCEICDEKEDRFKYLDV